MLYFLKFLPTSVNWIDFSCCHVSFPSESHALGALLSVSSENSQLVNSPETCPYIFRWRVGVSFKKTFNQFILMRFASKGDLRELKPDEKINNEKKSLGDEQQKKKLKDKKKNSKDKKCDVSSENKKAKKKFDSLKKNGQKKTVIIRDQSKVTSSEVKKKRKQWKAKDRKIGNNLSKGLQGLQI